MTGAVQPKINQSNLKSLEFPCYPEDLAKKYNKLAEPMFTKIKKHLLQSEQLRDSILPKLISGEVRVA